MPAASISSKPSSKTTTIVLGIAVLIVGAIVGFLILTQNGFLDPRNRAQELNTVNTTNTLPTKNTGTNTNTAVVPTAPAKTAPAESSTSSPLGSGQICKQDGGFCRWTAAVNASGYRYQIFDKTSGSPVKEGVTKSLEISFTPLVNHTYSCVITPISSCGEGTKATGENTCRQDATPTPTKPATTPTVTLTPTAGPSPTPTVGPSTTPTTKPTVTTVSTTPVTPTLPKAGFFTSSLLIVAIGFAIVALGFAL